MATKFTGAAPRATFGGRPKTTTSEVPKKTIKKLGGNRVKATGFSMNTPGNKEFGFVQNTLPKATAVGMGKPLPKTKNKATALPPTSKSQFKAGAGRRGFK